MIQKYFNIRPEDPGGARDEVSAPNVAEFFAKHVESASLGVFFFLLGVFHRRCIRFVVVYPLVACMTQIWQHFVGGTGAVRQSRVGITCTCRRNRAECAATLAHPSSVPKATRMVSCHLCWKWMSGSISYHSRGIQH